MACQPLLACRNTALFREQQGAVYITLPQAGKHGFNTTTDNHCESSGACRQARSAQLGQHSSAAKLTSTAACHSIQGAISGKPLGYHNGIRVLAGVFVEQPQLIGDRKS